MIQARDLTKRFGATVAVDHLSFDAPPGKVTGFLGPNGAGKSTTMRLLLELDRAQSGTATFQGKRYRDLRQPLHEVGALLDAAYVHPGRSAVNHLRWVAASNGIAKARAEECLGIVGLTDVAGKRVGGFSLGMRQRLGLATALLGDPHTLLLDEPANGLDPEGIIWIRQFLRYIAAQGRTVFVSSHLLGEMAQTADDLVVVGRGRLIANSTVDEFVRRFASTFISVRSPQSARLAELLRTAGATVEVGAEGRLSVTGMEAPAIGDLAAAHAVVLHELAPQQASLEEAFLEVTRGHEQHQGAALPGPPS